MVGSVRGPVRGRAPVEKMFLAIWFLGLEWRVRPIPGLPSSRCLSHSAQINCNFRGIRRLKTVSDGKLEILTFIREADAVF